MSEQPGAGIVADVRIACFRTVRAATLSLGPVTALVGEPAAGKSNLLNAIWAVLDPAAAQLSVGDQGTDGDEIEIGAQLSSGGALRLAGMPPDLQYEAAAGGPPALYLPAAARAGDLCAAPSPRGDTNSEQAARIFKRALGDNLDPAEVPSTAAPAAAAVKAIESCCAFGIRGIVLLIEEPELYLRPQGQRYLYRLLRQFAAGGNQVLYSTHSPAFLNPGRLDEVIFIERLPGQGTAAVAPEHVTPDADFRVLSEFDAERSELLLARSAVLVEGLTEKLALPFVFAALGIDHDREGITIVECGGKTNIPLYGRICRSAGVPFVSVHDSDAQPGRRPRASDRALHAEIVAVSGELHTVVLEPDFEGMAHLRRGTHKPEQAWRRFAALDVSDIAEPLLRTARIAVELARSGGDPAGQRRA